MIKIKEIKEIHDILFDALCYFDDFCRKNGINYFLSNGTLLGAAKYGDFIPWDDDVDVLMPRADYDKLMNLTAINNGKYRLLCVEQASEWRMPYAKLSCEETVIKEGEYDFGVSFGISVDIFPIDSWSSCLPVAKIQAFKSECMKRFLVCSIGGEFSTKKNGIKRMILKSIWIIGKKVGHERLKRSILKGVKKSKSKVSKYGGCRVWTCHLHHEVFPMQYFSEGTFLKFRDRNFPVITNYEEYLSCLYGDWRADLPHDKQHSNHQIKVWYKDAE